MGEEGKATVEGEKDEPWVSVVRLVGVQTVDLSLRVVFNVEQDVR